MSVASVWIEGGFTTRQRAIDLAEEMEREKLTDTYRRYKCPACLELHRRESAAESCCPRDVDEVWVAPDGEQFESANDLLNYLGESAHPSVCPICSAVWKDAWQVADCCLWKRYSPPARWRMAQAVESGMDWDEAIATAARVEAEA